MNGYTALDGFSCLCSWAVKKAKAEMCFRIHMTKGMRFLLAKCGMTIGQYRVFYIDFIRDCVYN